MMKGLKFEFLAAHGEWLGDCELIKCRVALKNEVKYVGFGGFSEFSVEGVGLTDNLHLVVQWDNLILASQALLLGKILGEDFGVVFEAVVEMEVDSENVSLITGKQGGVGAVNKIGIGIRVQVCNNAAKGVNVGEELSEVSELTDTDVKCERFKNEDVGDGEYHEGVRVLDDCEYENKLGPRVLSEFDDKTQEGVRVLKASESENEQGVIKKSEPENQESIRVLTSSESENIQGVKKLPISELEDHQGVRVLTLSKTENEQGVRVLHKSEPDHEQGVRVLQTSESDNKLSSRVLSDSESLIHGSLSERKPKYSNCKYIQRMSEIEAIIQKAKHRIDSLKVSLGSDFDKLIQESKSRESRSPTRSPQRSRGSGLSTPLITQKSQNTSIISSFRAGEENTIELPSKLEITLDRLSIQTKYPLVQSIFGLCAKKSYSTYCLQELENLIPAIKHQESSAAILKNAHQASEHESEVEFNSIDLFTSQIKSTNSSLLSSIESISNKSHLLLQEKQKLLKDLQSLSSNKALLLSSLKKPEYLNEIKEFEACQRKLEASRADLEAKLTETIEESKNFLINSNKDLESLQVQKDDTSKEVSRLLIECEKLENENKKLQRDLTIKQKISSSDQELALMLTTFHSWSTDNSDAVESLKRQLIYLRSSKLESTTDSQNLVQKLDKENKSLQTSLNSIQKSIAHHNETYQELQKLFKPIKQSVCHLEDLLSKKSPIEGSFDQSIQKLSQSLSIFSSILQEVNYLSDFVFSTSQWAMQHQRIKDQVKSLLQGKNIEFDALKSALSELKSKNPVYLPLQGDYIDEALAVYLNARDGVLEIPFYRESYGVYYFGTKKLMLTYERGKLIVKTGGGFLPIDQFIDTYLVPELDKKLKGKNVQADKTEYNPILDYKCDTPIIEEDI